MVIILTFINFFLIYFLINFLISKSNFKIIFSNYIASLKEIKKISKSLDQSEVIFNKISRNGAKLILNIIFLIIPYLLSYIILSLVFDSIYLKIIISSLPYLLKLSKN